jgi:hypothetical protein
MHPKLVYSIHQYIQHGCFGGTYPAIFCNHVTPTRRQMTAERPERGTPWALSGNGDDPRPERVTLPQDYQSSIYGKSTSGPNVTFPGKTWSFNIGLLVFWIWENRFSAKNVVQVFMFQVNPRVRVSGSTAQ